MVMLYVFSGTWLPNLTWMITSYLDDLFDELINTWIFHVLSYCWLFIYDDALYIHMVISNVS